jgi:NADPH:quinone reductase-like Zn-dependent oxidoreductase
VFEGEPGFDIVLDPIGGESWRTSLDLLRSGGRLVMYGFSVATPDGHRGSPLNRLMAGLKIPFLKMVPPALLHANKGVFGIDMGRMFPEADRITGWMTEITALWTEGRIRPAIHATVPLDRASEAHRMLHARENVGKIVLVP